MNSPLNRNNRTGTGLSTTSSQRIHTREQGRVNTGDSINYGPASNFEIWQIARAATAAPLYFAPLELKIENDVAVFEDGGFGQYNNPTYEGIREVKKLHGKSAVGIVVSVGTARAAAKYGRTTTHRIEMIIHTATDPERVEEQVRAASSKEDGFTYFRLNEPGLLEVPLDEWKPKSGQNSGEKTLKAIKDRFLEWHSEHHDLLSECAHELVRQRRIRAMDRNRWEHFAIGAVYRCLGGCLDVEGCHAKFKDRASFRSHLVGHHNKKEEEIDDQELRRCMEPFKYREAPR